MRFRSPNVSPAAPSRTIPTVSIRHPAYALDNELLLLSAVDGDGISYDGIDFDTALLACGIITGNTWDEGWLAKKVGIEYIRVDRPEDGILRGRVYYFLLNEKPEFKYPVHPSFDHWRFPHGRLPSIWSELCIPLSDPAPQPMLKRKVAALVRDGNCRISGHRDAIELAHLVPLAESGWFSSNDMKRYTRSPAELNPIDDEQNLVLLRSDLHHLFDRRRFTFVAKRSASDDLDGQDSQLVLHVLLPHSSTEMVGLYQNKKPRKITGVTVEMLFARFAWSIFTDDILRFFRGPSLYGVLVFDADTGIHETRHLHAPGIHKISRLFPAQSTSRSVSPLKRNINQVSMHGVYSFHDEGQVSNSEEGGDEVDKIACGDWLVDDWQMQTVHDEEETRGRSRKRERSPELGQFTPNSSTCSESTSQAGIHQDEVEDIQRKRRAFYNIEYEYK